MSVIRGEHGDFRVRWFLAAAVLAAVIAAVVLVAVDAGGGGTGRY
jgi:hypothetical protein